MTNLALWDTERQMQHVRAYCAANPHGYYGRAVADLIDTMRFEQRVPDWRR